MLRTVTRVALVPTSPRAKRSSFAAKPVARLSLAVGNGEHCDLVVVTCEEDHVRKPMHERLLVWSALAPQGVPMRTLGKRRKGAINFEDELFAHALLSLRVPVSCRSQLKLSGRCE